MDEQRDDKWFREQIKCLCQSEKGSPQWNSALSRLIPAIASLPRLKRNNNPQYAEDYQEVFNKVMEKVADKICQDFQPQNESIKVSLEAWINEKMRLRYEVLGIYPTSTGSKRRQKTAKQEFKEQAKKPPYSLNTLLSQESDETFEDYLAYPTFEGLDDLIKQDQEKLKEQERYTSLKLANYINLDPQEKLRRRSPRGYPNCNYQLLAQRFCLKEPPDDKAEVAREFGIPYQKFYADFTRNFMPVIAGIGIELGYQPEQLRQFIEQDPNEKLRNCHPRNQPACNAQFLAQRLLPIFQNPPASFEQIAQEINIAAEKIQRHWEKKCLPLLGKIALEQGYQLPGEP
ncbi:MAG: hypothetical protein KME08_10890 [Aphanothece sp. CMT-3BRIN-NPC111]|jgi:hypothetical protein|nr:hypothetical protein [Aphanothece sp. CMT-3BRIN-NPC111]